MSYLPNSSKRDSYPKVQLPIVLSFFSEQANLQPPPAAGSASNAIFSPVIGMFESERPRGTRTFLSLHVFVLRLVLLTFLSQNQCFCFFQAVFSDAAGRFLIPADFGGGFCLFICTLFEKSNARLFYAITFTKTNKRTPGLKNPNPHRFEASIISCKSWTSLCQFCLELWQKHAL